MIFGQSQGWVYHFLRLDLSLFGLSKVGWHTLNSCTPGCLIDRGWNKRGGVGK